PIVSQVPITLTVQDLRSRGLLQALAKAFDHRHDMDELLDGLTFPSERRPANAPSAITFWAEVCADIEKGVTRGGLEALLQAAANPPPSTGELGGHSVAPSGWAEQPAEAAPMMSSATTVTIRRACVFISHVSQDADFVERHVKPVLREAGLADRSS